jgi:hypothetical protein
MRTSHTLLEQHGRDLGYRHARRQLPAGHRDHAVVEELEGDVRLCRGRGGDRELAAVEVGAVAEVLEE